MKKIVIIGGGIAGLSAGIYAQLCGFASEIYEKNSVAGGQCMGWDRKGHHIDNCIHWLTGTKKGTELYKLWETVGALGDDIPMADKNSFCTSTLDGKSATLWKDLNRTEQELLKIAPEDTDEIRKFFKYIRLAECCEMPVNKPMDMMNIGDYIKLGKKMSGMGKVMKAYGGMDVEDLSNRFKNPLLRKLITDALPKEFYATALFASYATINSGNGGIPLQGSLAMVNRMIERYRTLGGILHTNSSVKKVNMNGNKADGILLADGTKIAADYVICATDTAHLFEKLLDASYMDAHLKKCYDNSKDYPVFSGFQMAFSIDRKALKEETIHFDCKPFQAAGKSVSRISAKSYCYDSYFAPEGKTVLQTNIFQHEDDFAYWKSLDKQAYKQQKQAISQAVMERIVEAFPDVKDSIELLDSWTPLTYERYCNAYHGSYMAFITKKNVKPHTVKGEIKGLSNVLIASQWLMSPGGLPTAAAMGKFAIQRILKKRRNQLLYRFWRRVDNQ